MPKYNRDNIVIINDPVEGYTCSYCSLEGYRDAYFDSAAELKDHLEEHRQVGDIVDEETEDGVDDLLLDEVFGTSEYDDEDVIEGAVSDDDEEERFRAGRTD